MIGLTLHEPSAIQLLFSKIQSLILLYFITVMSAYLPDKAANMLKNLTHLLTP